MATRLKGDENLHDALLIIEADAASGGVHNEDVLTLVELVKAERRALLVVARHFPYSGGVTLTGDPVETFDRLRVAVERHVEKTGAEYDQLIQLRRDIDGIRRVFGIAGEPLTDPHAVTL